jgi:hypothetical protein
VERQKTLLAVLAVAVLMLAVRGAWPWLSRLDDSVGAVSFGRTGGGFDTTLPELTPLRLADLELKPGEYHPGRDPFRFAAKPPPPRPRPKPRPVKPAPRKAPAKQPGQQGGAKPPAPKPPPVDVKYLGSFGPSNGKIAVFGDGTDIFNVRKGGILKEHFLVESINYESADLKYVNFPKLPPARLAAGK